ncbi:3-hydroxyacyl-CoA dehydrogenase NAD-binding domain-containing protein [Sphingobium sp.]|uniref:3-hydroxyacyl-CoA dehydrogenase NAD-binding domain-containing protein n=1 Tax=Sphingobium sp. TaxID=1912891 RepID=UPI0028BF1F71|nr:3-hydroxyacyl-CoA dehydrogenase NAD-binding domain-containing protein [Sphingobium sp.]
MNLVVNSVVSLETEGEIAIVAVDSPPVNALGQRVREGVLLGIRKAIGQKAKAVVLLCKGPTFFAGADISELDRPILEPTLDVVEAAIEDSPIPVVAAIHGTALGGGLEVAMACHYRVAVPSARLGLPEVALGLLPGAGGTQRAPRLMGIEAAIGMIAGGKPVMAAEGIRLGLLDALVDEGELRGQAIAFARELLVKGAPLKRARDLPVDLSPEEAQAAADRYRAKNPAQFRGFKAPGNILKAVVAAAELPFDQGIAREWELFSELLSSEESEAQRYAFFAERIAGKVPGLDKTVRPRAIATTGVVGAGTMGTGIAIALLNAGFPVTLVDLNAEALDKARARIAGTIQGQADKGRIPSDAAAARIAALSSAGDLSALTGTDLVIEAVFERPDLKKTIFAQLDAVMKPGAILATNTSFLDVNEIAAATARPHDVVGLHFFAPANIMRLLEIVRGDKTAGDVLATALWLGRKLGKLAVVSGVCDGFIANRLMARRGETADRLILNGPPPADIDRVMVDYGFPMGPFQMVDLVGLDVIGWDRENSAGRTVQEILCEAGHWGQKTGSGYYDYSQGTAAPAADALAAIAAIRERNRIEPRSYDDAQLLHALLDPVVNEGAKLVDEGIVYRASDIDMALIAGYGWPVYRGGPMFWGDSVGLPGVVERLKARVAAGEDIVISPLLERYAIEGRRFVHDDRQRGRAQGPRGIGEPGKGTLTAGGHG